MTSSPSGMDRWGLATWLALCLALGLPAALLPIVDLNQPASAWPDWVQPWVLHPQSGWHQHWMSWWTTAWLHGSPPHLWRNLGGLALIGALGWVAQARPTATMAWFLAWPLTQVGMLMRPELTSYIGLSGVLHAGAAVLALQQVVIPNVSHSGRHQQNTWPGWILLAALVFKVFMENPWGAVLILSSASAIKVAPWAHFSGLMAGLACGGVFFMWDKCRPPNSSVSNR